MNHCLLLCILAAALAPPAAAAEDFPTDKVAPIHLEAPGW